MDERSANPIKLRQIEPFEPYAIPAVVVFTATLTPTEANYAADYAPTYGLYPKVQLLVSDGAGNYFEKEQKPKWIYTDGVLTSLEWQFGEEITGIVILKK